ncbi:hypothetical protein NM688_g4483 [Phlebia brevispora]|uniref:Uncharacterized protein n=1 Tax=Phlebia brevispora TaxID=194682 RepID=A0ACC1T356_9APHY|nr:hypothetical protein NM688_g4483 [Phlebia brevispora]
MPETTFTLSPNNPSDAEISSSSGEVQYRVVTTREDKTVTRVFNSAGSVIASLEWGIGSPDRVKYGDEKARSMTEWMKKSPLPFKKYISFTDDQRKEYHWKGLEETQGLELYSEHDHYETAICRFENGDTGSSTDASEAWITLSSHALEIQDLVIVSFLFLEKGKREHHGEKHTTSSANIITSLFRASQA